MSEYLIWSNEHRAWWGPGRHGYVQAIDHAGRYSKAEALDICANAMPGTNAGPGMFNEIPVRQADMDRIIEMDQQWQVRKEQARK
jgi:hypothetical protein